MKLVKLYCNLPEIFHPINFNEGLNIIFGRVKNKGATKDSHNLGKTFFINVIDFCFLAEIDKAHPFKSKSDRFDGFTFCLVLRSNDGKLITVGRNIKNSNKIYIHTGQRPDSAQLDENWSYSGISLAKAKKLLNDLLDLKDITPFLYRKGLTYSMRRQSDYNDVFRTSRFVRSADIFWKPYVAKIIGLDYDNIDEKYKLDSDIEKTKDEIKALENAMGRSVSDFDEMRGIIDIRRREVASLQKQLDNWDFKEIDRTKIESLIYEVDVQLNESNEKMYKLKAEVELINESLNEQFQFNVDEVEEIYAEVGIYFPDQLKKSYNDLIKFNKSISETRNKRLLELKDRLISQITSHSRHLDELNDRRKSSLQDLIDAKAFDKMKIVHSQIKNREREIASLEGSLQHLDETSAKQIEIRKMNRKRDESITKVIENVRGKNESYTVFRQMFSEISAEILRTKALFSTKVYDNGSIDFEIKTLDENDSSFETSEALGTSYKKMLCVSFDISIVCYHSEGSFYRFIYHDGVFEGLDNVRKVNLLSTVKQKIADHGFQYILTVIDTDRPRDIEDNKLLFSDEEIILSLHDDGDSGRLFKMPKF